MPTCTLTITDDYHAEFEDDILHRRSASQHVSGPLGGDRLERETIAVLNQLVGDHDCKRPVLTLLGRYLYKVAFGDTSNTGEIGPLGHALKQTYETYKLTKQAGTPPLTLRLVIDKAATELGGYPWEFLCMPGEQRDVFLAEEDSQVILTRFVPRSDTDDSTLPAEDSKLKILIVLSQPGGSTRARVSADELIKRVRELHSEHIDVTECEEPATKATVMSAIQRIKPHIVHFIGHGRPGEIAFVKAEAELKAERAMLDAKRLPGDPDPIVDEAHWADSVSVRECLLAGLDHSNRAGRIVFLHACHGASESAPTESLRGFSSVARELAYRDNVAGVVAMQYPITNLDAETFATKFYECVRAGSPLEEAVGKARRELGIRAESDKQSWNDRGFGTPVIYVRTVGPVFRPGPANDQQEIRPARKLRCPYHCGQLVRSDSRKCPNPKCGRDFIPCPNKCDGLVPLVAGGECTNCEYAISAGAESGAGATRAPAADSSDVHGIVRTAATGVVTPAMVAEFPRGDDSRPLGLQIDEQLRRGGPREGE